MRRSIDHFKPIKIEKEKNEDKKKIISEEA